MKLYRPRRAPRHETLRIRGLDLHINRWGPDPSASRPPVLLLHGWQDIGATFQFMVDCFDHDWPLVAPDWRGFGRSDWPQEGYWFPDYFADLDALLERLAPVGAVRLVGHSMGGNIAMIYAGLRPQRVSCVASLEGFGLRRSTPEEAPVQLRKWLNQVRTQPALKDYDSIEQLDTIIRFRYPRFTEEQAGFVATSWSAEGPSGRTRLHGDARHRWANPYRYHREDAEACWREVKAPVLLVLGDRSDLLENLGEDGTAEAFHRQISDLEIVRVPGAGHMLHIEKAHIVAPLVSAFLSAHEPGTAAG